MEVSVNNDAILSDDYEEGEILDEDTLYDNVSSLEEFSGSDSELKLHGEVSSTVVKKTISSGHKEKHHRRKEHKCKEDSICRKERSGKHCYARIRRGKTVEDAEKNKSADFVVTHLHDLHNSKKKSHVILSPIHDTLAKYNSRRLSVQKDLHEKENRISHKHSRYYDSHKSLPHRIDKKKFSDKAKKYFVLGNGRSHERKRSRSPSPKLPVRSQIKELAASRGKTSLLKRLVGSGSLGVKTPKDIEEPRKTSSSADNANDEPSKDVGIEECQFLIIEDEEENQNSDNIIKHQDSDESLKLEVISEEAVQKTLDYVENSVDPTIIDCQQKEIQSNQICEIVESKEIKQDPINMIDNIALVPPEKSMHCQPESKVVDAEISEVSKLIEEHVIHEVIIESENKIVANTSHGNSSHTDEGTHKSEQEIPEDTDELLLRLEALRTAMLRKHKERKKRGFICRKKSTLEDDSFAEYVLSHIDKDNSLMIKDEDHNEIGQTDCNGVNMLGDLLNPVDMVIDKNDKGEDVENNILENFPYPPNYPLPNSDMPVHYVGFPVAYSVYPYPVMNGNMPFPPVKENTDLVPNAERNLPHDFPSYPLPSSQVVVSPLEPDTSQIPLPEDRVSFPRAGFYQTVKDHSNEKDCMENCLKEINSNKELIERNKRVRKLPSRYKLCRRSVLNGKKWHTSRAVIKRKLERREYAEQKRKRKESIRDLKIITERAINKELNEEESDEETALRELALKSVKEREKPKNLLESASLQEKDKSNHNNNSINMNEDQNLTDLQIGVDTNLNSKPLISYDSESTPTNLSSEPWDDIDEDILRAQLLSSLSSRIPVKHMESATTFGPKYTKKQVRKALLRAERKCFDVRSDKKLKLLSLKVNKENFKRIAKIKSNDVAKRKMDCISQNMNTFKKNATKITQSVGQSSTEVPIVPKFIISLKEDSSSEDETIQHQVQTAAQPDLVKSIDLFLQEARIENDLKQGLLGQDEKEGNSTKPDEIKHPAAEEIKVQNKSEKINTGGSTPQVLKHLPAWQQEEYRRLKKQIAEKEKVLKAAKERVLLPNDSDEMLKEANLTKNLKSKNQLNKEENNSCSENIEEIDHSCGENVSDCMKTMENDVSPANNSEGPTNNKKEAVIAPQQSNAAQLSATSNDSTKIVDDVNHLAKIVAQLEKGMGDYRTLKEGIERKKKEILIARLNMVKQRKLLFEIKKNIITEEKMIQTKLEQDILQPDVTKNDPNDKKKPASRDLELCKLRLREFSLRTKMIFDEIDHSSGLNKTMKINPKAGVMPVDKSKTALQTVANCKQRIDKAPNKITRQPKLLPNIEKSKRNNNNNYEQRSNITNGSLSVSGKQSENWDPFVPICPFDLSGVCKDEECKFQHIKAA